MSSKSALLISLAAATVGLAACGPAQEPPQAQAQEHAVAVPDADPEALQIAQAVLRELGGREAWEATRFVRWNFFGRRMHHWDRETGDIRIRIPAGEKQDGTRSPGKLILLNVGTRQGRAWVDGVEVTREEELAGILQDGHEIWVNDSYWMFMPYKLLDPGVRLRYAGEREMEDGRPADVLDLTFDEGIGYTPENRYEVYVARDTGRIEQWAFFAEASEEEPRFVLPWTGWRQFGAIWLATNHGRDRSWDIAVFDDLPRSVFESPEPVTN